jgi:Luciferase-like monooxygenase
MSSSRPCSLTNEGRLFRVGEHHRDNFAVSSPEVILAAMAGWTNRIHVGSAVTVMSSGKPVRAFERSAALDAAPQGRAEVIRYRAQMDPDGPRVLEHLAREFNREAVPHITGGGFPSALARRAGSHSHSRHAWRNADRTNSSPTLRGSGLLHTSSQ